MQTVHTDAVTPRRLTARTWWLRVAVAAAVLLPMLLQSWNAPGDDLSSSYIGCRLLATGAAGALYDHDPVRFDRVGDSPAWDAVAADHGYRSVAHPYVQTPLWAAVLRPACMAVEFPAFAHAGLLLIVACIVAMLEVVARTWAPRFLDWRWMALAALAMAYCTPYRYTLWLVQTHPVFVLLSLLALALADRGRWRSAGVALALAAAVKVTPVLLVAYWLVRGQWRPAVWCVVASLVVLVATVGWTGVALFEAYLGSMQRVSHVLLVAFNNQSFAAWWLGRSIPREALWQWTALSLPPVVALAGTACALAAAAAGGWIDRRTARPGPGALAALVGATVFSAIAWSHYFIVVVPALMVLVDRALAQRTWRATGAFLALAVAAWVLNARPLAMDPFTGDQLGRFAVVRSHYWSALLVMAGLLAIAWTGATRQGRSAPTAEPGTDRRPLAT